MDTLTDKQSKLLKFIKNYTSHHSYPPSLKEMADHMGIRSLSTIHQHLQAIRSKGLISQSSSRERNITIRNVPKLIKIPLVGEIAAGLPIEPIEEPEPVFVSTTLVKSPIDHYALKVRGNSMIDDNIQDGDTVIIKSQTYIGYVGQTIVAIIDGGATLKRFGGITQDGLIKLVPKNPNMKAFFVDARQLEVRGVLVGLMRGGI